MPLFSKHKEGDLLWGIWKMEEEISELLSFFSTPNSYVESMKAFVTEGRRKEWLSVRVLLSVLGGEEKQILYHPNEKPYLKDHSFYISISHTRGYVAVALHPSQEVGIDIEKYGDKVCKVRCKFLQPEEDSRIVKEKEIIHLLLHWSAKEAVYKLLGIEGVELKEHLRVLPFVPDQQGTFTVKELKTGTGQQFPVNYITHPDFVLTYTVG